MAIVLVGVGAASGCFQEVHYTGPIDTAVGGTSTQHAGEFAVIGGSASGFGDDLVAALAVQPAQSARVDFAAASSVATPVERPGDGRAAPSPADLSDALNQGFLGATYPPVAEPAARPVVEVPAQPLVVSPGSAAATDAGTGRYPNDPMPTSMPASTTVAPIETAPTVISTPPVQVSRGEAARTRRAAFLLGSKWSVATLSRDRGATANNVARWFSQARAVASYLGTTLNDVPPATSELQTTTVVLVNYLINDGKRIGRDLVQRHGPDHAALFELGVKSNLLLVLYAPRASLSETLTASIASARELAGSPIELWQPLLDAVAAGQDPAEVRRIVLQVHDVVDAALAAAMEQ